MASHAELDKFLFQLGELMKKHKVAKAAIVFHPPGTDAITYATALMGNPSIEWALGAGEMYYKQLSEAIKKEHVTSGRFKANIGTPIEVPSAIIKPPGGFRAN